MDLGPDLGGDPGVGLWNPNTVALLDPDLETAGCGVWCLGNAKDLGVKDLGLALDPEATFPAPFSACEELEDPEAPPACNQSQLSDLGSSYVPYFQRTFLAGADRIGVRLGQ